MMRRRSNGDSVDDGTHRQPSSSTLTMDEEYLLLVAERDDQIARRNFDKLCPIILHYVDRRLRSLGIYTPDADEISQDVIEQLWESRTKIRSRTEHGWFSFIRKIVAHKVSKYYEGRNKSREIPFQDVSHFEDSQFSRILNEIVYGNPVKRVADKVWLKSDSNKESSEYELAIFVSYLRYFELKSWHEITHLLPQLQFSDEDQLDQWLSDNVNVFDAAFLYLYFSPSSLSVYLLNALGGDALVRPANIAADIRYQAIDLTEDGELLRQYIIVEHYLRGVAIANIKRSIGEKIGESRIQEAYEEVRAFLPFKARSEKVVRFFELGTKISAEDRKSICKRLAFQYYTIDELSPGQVEEMIIDIAASFKCKISRSTLSNWLTRGRLYDELEKRIGEED